MINKNLNADIQDIGQRLKYKSRLIIQANLNIEILDTRYGTGTAPVQILKAVGEILQRV